MAELAIEIDDVSLQFGAVKAVDHLALEVRRGTVFGFLGPNGAGKTTTLRLLLGLLRPGTGRVRVLGLDPRAEGARIRASVGVLLEGDGLYDRLSALDNLDFHGRIHHLARAERQARIEAVLRSFGLWERRRDRVNTWSKGMRQKLAIARALLHRPPLLLLDEPFTGLDPVAAADLRESIVTLAREGGSTVFLTTHDLAHVEKSCTEVAVIKDGHVVASGPPGELLGADGGEEVMVTGAGLTGEVLDALRVDRVITGYRLQGAGARLRCERSSRALLGTELVRRGVMLEELHTVRASLEEEFLSLVRSGAAEPAAREVRS